MGERARPMAAVLMALVALAARADSVDCPGGIVRTGDAKIDLLAKCGQPSLVEGTAREKGAFDVASGIARRVASPIDVWTYDLGRNRFVQRVRIERGRVRAIEPGGYGHADAPPPRARPPRATCEPAALSPGRLTLEILSRCGEPAVKDEWQEELASARTEGGQVVYAEVVTRAIAVWTYDFGPAWFVRFVRIEDGRVTRVETGSYGYGE